MQNAVKTEAKLEFKLFAVGEQHRDFNRMLPRKKKVTKTAPALPLDSEARAVVTEVKKKRG